MKRVTAFHMCTTYCDLWSHMYNLSKSAWPHITQAVHVTSGARKAHSTIIMWGAQCAGAHDARK
eukprot:9469236-Pyramimonas_sp.AAC.2